MKQTGLRLRSCTNHPTYVSGCNGCRRRDATYQIMREQSGRTARSAPAEITMQRLRELRANGYSLPMLSAETGLEPETIKVVSLGKMRRVQLRTFWAVERAYFRLRDIPGGCSHAASWARKHGWTAPEPPPLPEDYLDLIAVERAVRGERMHLTRAEISEAWRQLEHQGMSAAQISARLGVTARTVQRWRDDGPTTRQRNTRTA